MLVAIHDILLQITWIPFKENFLTDMLSRFEYQKITDIYPQLAPLQILETRTRSGTGFAPSLGA